MTKRKLKKIYNPLVLFMQTDLDMQDALADDDFPDGNELMEERDELFWVLYEAVENDLY